MTNPATKINLQAMSFGLALVGQTIMLVGYITGIAGDVETAVRDIDRNVARIDMLEAAVQEQEVLLARISSDLSAIRKAWSVWMNVRVIATSLLISGCATIDMPSSTSYPSICDGDTGCEKEGKCNHTL